MSAAERVAEFLRQWKMSRGNALYSDTIYAVHKDPRADQAELTVADLEALIGDAQ